MCNVSAYRKFAGFTQQEMAQYLDISISSYRNKEGERTAFNDFEKVKIKNLVSDYFPDITIDEIFFKKKVSK